MIKYVVSILFFLLINKSFAQQNLSFSAIDYRVQSIEPATAADLAHTLVMPYSTDIQKVRAIFSWVAQHIEYKVKKSNSRSYTSSGSIKLKPIDSNINSADEYVAELVLRNQSGVCEGYARLFKTLCDYAGIKCTLVTGYARGDINHIGTQFISNHYWNVVFVDSAWHLIDVTWASGYFTYYSNEFIKHFDDYYFFTDPDLFIRDHFPDDLQWTLLTTPHAPEEFSNSPFKQRAFVKYNIYFFSPRSGIINAVVGDTIRIELETSDMQSDKRKSVDTASLDSNMLSKYSSVVFLKPVIDGNKMKYEFPVTSQDVEWLHIMYNNDVVLRYKLIIKKDKIHLQ
jgi:transglutaminase/protease-like cytokinesis protein 3